MSEQPNNPFNQMASGAITANEMYKAYVDAGFTEEQALDVIKDLNRTTLLYMLNQRLGGGNGHQ